MLDATQLRSFVVVAEELHFGRAAARLNLTQSPLSRQVQNLEHSLGVALLERTSRSVRLTHAGRLFLPEARRVLETMSAAASMARQAAAGETGVVHLGFTSAAAHEVLPRLVKQLRAELPGVELVLEQMVTADQIQALEAHRLDLALLRPFAPITGGRAIASALLVRERLVLAAPAGHPFAAGPTPTLQALDGQPFITWSTTGGLYFNDLLASVFRHGGVAPRTVQRLNETHAILALVQAGLGLALVPISARAFSMTGVVLREMALPNRAQAELVLSWRQNDANPACARVRAMALALFDQPPAPAGSTR